VVDQNSLHPRTSVVGFQTMDYVVGLALVALAGFD
jgi:hypothetical protein